MTGTVHLTVLSAGSAGRRVQRERCRHGTDLGDVSARKNKKGLAEAEAAKDFLKLANDRGLSLTGRNGLLKQFTKNVLEAALKAEMTEHLGHEKNRATEGRESANVPHGSRPKTVLTAATDPVEIEVPRGRDGTFEPVIVRSASAG